jgi:uncharacterized secreted protein with C-terminal beta-propeller domain
MRRTAPVAAALVLAAISGCTGGLSPVTRVPVPDPPGAAPYRLASFSSCGDLLRGLRDAAKASVGPYQFGFGGGYPAPGVAEDRAGAATGPIAPTATAPEHSTTNVHEAGVDEPDLVKADGRRIVTVADGTLQVVDAATRRVAGSLRLDAPGRLGRADLLLAGDRVLVLQDGYSGVIADGPVSDGPVPSGPGGIVEGDRVAPTYSGPRLMLVDLAGPAPRLVGTLSLDGRYLDARMVGSTVRVVLSSTPRINFGYDPGATTDAQRLAHNRQVIDRTGIDAWLPRYTLRRDGRTTSGRVDCSAVSTPATYSGAGMLTVLTLDLAAPLGTGDPVSVAADGDIVYATPGNLYVANDQRWRFWRGPVAQGAGARTELYQFDISGAGPPRFLASGAVTGWLLNQYSMSEFGGRLRVASTSQPPWRMPTGAMPPIGRPPQAVPLTDSAVSVLTRQGDRLALTGLVRGLGKGEQIYAVRFVGPTGYVVTFRRTDPLYTVDLSEPGHPRVAGELKITGYSAYLHPLDGARLIGVGQEAGGSGATEGLQVSLFDVSDAALPTRISRYQVPGTYSGAEYDPHAFLYWPATGTLVVPVQSYPSAGGALVLRVRDGGLTEVGTVAPAGGQSLASIRSLVIGGTLWTLTDGGLQANDLTTLAEQAWLPLR